MTRGFKLFQRKNVREAVPHLSLTRRDKQVIKLVCSVDTRGPLTILAADCEASLQAEKLDCSTETKLEDLD